MDRGTGVVLGVEGEGGVEVEVELQLGNEARENFMDRRSDSDREGKVAARKEV